MLVRRLSYHSCNIPNKPTIGLPCVLYGNYSFHNFLTSEPSLSIAPFTLASHSLSTRRCPLLRAILYHAVLVSASLRFFCLPH
jgi:hypothetical protein